MDQDIRVIDTVITESLNFVFHKHKILSISDTFKRFLDEQPSITFDLFPPRYFAYIKRERNSKYSQNGQYMAFILF